MAKAVFKTRLGWVGIEGSAKGVRRILLPTRCRTSVSRELGGVHEPHRLKSVRNKLLRYYGGCRVDFSGVKLDLSGYTRFQRRVWSCAAKIPYGSTVTYSQLARRMREPKAHRAVGNALNRNPFPPLIPCHRVVAASGLGGFARGKILKVKMLDLEQRKLRKMWG